MGARINFVFDDGTDSLVNLYSHWGEDSWQEDLVGALIHAQKRKGDYSYFTRMVISHLMKEQILDETGFGIYAINRSEIGNQSFDKTVVLDLVNNLLTDLDDGSTVELYGKVYA
jgi:hypothetical protein